MKRVADEEQPVVVVQIVVDPVVVQDAVAVIRVQHRHVPVAVIVERGRAASIRIESHPDHRGLKKSFR